MPELQEAGIRCQVLCECKEFQGLGLHLHTYFPTGENMTQDKIIKMAIEAKLPHYWESGNEIVYIERIEHFAKLVAQHEREACAKWLEDVVDAPNWADVIRARGQV
jgi:hypothetical protein